MVISQFQLMHLMTPLAVLAGYTEYIEMGYSQIGVIPIIRVGHLPVYYVLSPIQNHMLDWF